MTSRPPPASPARFAPAGAGGWRLLLAAALLGAAVTGHATDWQLSLDARLVSSDAGRPLTEGGFGTVRFGSNEEGLALGRARFAVTQQLGERWSAHLDASMYDNRDRSPVGVTEAYLLFRPYPLAGYRFRLKAGGFYAPISLENRASGWESPYSLSFSAINSWLAVEVRTLGIEGQLEWLGTRGGHDFDLGLTAGVFGWNEGAGEVVANSGFAFSDRQTALFGRVGPPGGVGTPGAGSAYGALPFEQIDHRAGAYAGLEARYFDRVVLRVLRYDNRADPAQIDQASAAVAWNTRFTSAGVRIESEHGWTAIAQWLSGATAIAPAGQLWDWPFRSGFALLSRRIGRHSVSARYDQFRVDSNSPPPDFEPYGWQRGHAFSAAWMLEVDAHWRLALEWLRVSSHSYNRPDSHAGPPFTTETQLQLAVRYALGSAQR